ncbi:MAG: FAD-binding oxidoreductase, partial [Tumebacillaceae bacterium]
MQPEHMQTALSDLLGATSIFVEADHLVVEPANEEEVAQVLAFATQHRLSVVPMGGGSQMHVGGPMERTDIILSLRKLDQIREYSPADLTVTVQAGTPLRHLQALLR